MKRLRVNRDITPLSDFRARLTRCIEQVQTSKRPMVITQRGHSAAVVLDVEVYDELVEELELLRELQRASRQLEAGQGVEHDDARRKLLDEFDE